MKDFDWTTSILMLAVGVILLIYQIYKQSNSIAEDSSPYTMTEHQQKLLGRFKIYLASLGLILIGAISILKNLRLM